MKFQEIKEYFTDNPQGYWFKRKLYGWGWFPVKWQGWLTMGIFMAYIFWIAFSLSPEPDSEELNWFFIKIIIGVAVLFYICFKKGESPKWQWGIPKKDNQD